MSKPEEPEFQWLEDALVQLARSGFALFMAVITISVAFAFAVSRLIYEPD